jgi:hypothetical protein
MELVFQTSLPRSAKKRTLTTLILEDFPKYILKYIFKKKRILILVNATNN